MAAMRSCGHLTAHHHISRSVGIRPLQSRFLVGWAHPTNEFRVEKVVAEIRSLRFPPFQGGVRGGSSVRSKFPAPAFMIRSASEYRGAPPSPSPSLREGGGFRPHRIRNEFLQRRTLKKPTFLKNLLVFISKPIECRLDRIIITLDRAAKVSLGSIE